MSEENNAPDAEGGDNKSAEDDKLFTQDQLNKIITDRLARSEKKMRAEMEARFLVDESFREKALDAWDVKPPENSGGGLDDEKVQELYKTWEQKHVQPLREARDGLATKVESLERRHLEADILSAAAGAGIQKAMLKQQGNGHSALFQMLSGNFSKDEDGEWRVVGPDGHFRPSPDGEKLYMEPRDFVKEWASYPENAPFVDDTTQGGSSFERDSKDGGKRIYTRAEYSKLVADEAYYEAHRDELAAADREGRVRG